MENHCICKGSGPGLGRMRTAFGVMSSPARHFCSAVSYAASQAARLALEERPASCPYTRAECLAGAGPGAGPSPTQRPASPFTWWMAASRRPRRTRSSSAPRRWLEAVTRTCSCSSTRPYQATASARWLLGGGRGCKRAQDALPTSTPAPPAPTSSVAPAWVFQLPTCWVTLGRSLYLSGSQTRPFLGRRRPEDTVGNRKTLPFPGRCPGNPSWTDLGSNLNTHPKPTESGSECSLDISTF